MAVLLGGAYWGPFLGPPHRQGLLETLSKRPKIGPLTEGLNEDPHPPTSPNVVDLSPHKQSCKAHTPTTKDSTSYQYMPWGPRRQVVASLPAPTRPALPLKALFPTTDWCVPTSLMAPTDTCPQDLMRAIRRYSHSPPPDFHRPCATDHLVLDRCASNKSLFMV